MCGWPAGKPRKPKNKLDGASSLDDLVNDLNSSGTTNKKKNKPVKNADDQIDVDDDDDSESENVHGVICADADGLWGISYDVRNIIVWKRTKFSKDTTVETSFAGKECIKTYKAGEYSDWVHERGQNKGPYYGSLHAAINYIKRGMVKSEIQKNQSLSVVLQAIKDSEKRTEKMLLGSQMSGLNFAFTEEHTFTDFEIINVREVADTFDNKIRLEETNLHFGGIQTKISAETKQHMEFFLWKLDEIFSKKRDLNISLYNQYENKVSEKTCLDGEAY